MKLYNNKHNLLFAFFVFDLLLVAHATPFHPPESYDDVTNSSRSTRYVAPDGYVNRPAYDPKHARILYGIGFLIMSVNFLGILFVFYRTLTAWFMRGELSMSLRVPFYISSTEFILYVLHSINQGYAWVYMHPVPGTACKVIGGLTFSFIAFQMSTVGAIALATYLRVCLRKFFDFGPYDWKLLGGCASLAGVLAVVVSPNYGASTYWCYSAPRVHTLPIVSTVLVIVVLGVTTFCYVETIRAVNGANLDDLDQVDTLAHRAKIEQIVIRKIASYIFIFILQWAPISAYTMGLIFDYEELWIYILCDISINLGGIANAIQYIMNEGLFKSYTRLGTNVQTSNLRACDEMVTPNNTAIFVRQTSITTTTMMSHNGNRFDSNEFGTFYQSHEAHNDNGV